MLLQALELAAHFFLIATLFLALSFHDSVNRRQAGRRVVFVLPAVGASLQRGRGAPAVLGVNPRTHAGANPAGALDGVRGRQS